MSFKNTFVPGVDASTRDRPQTRSMYYVDCDNVRECVQASLRFLEMIWVQLKLPSKSLIFFAPQHSKLQESGINSSSQISPKVIFAFQYIFNKNQGLWGQQTLCQKCCPKIATATNSTEGSEVLSRWIRSTSLSSFEIVLQASLGVYSAPAFSISKRLGLAYLQLSFCACTFWDWCNVVKIVYKYHHKLRQIC